MNLTVKISLDHRIIIMSIVECLNICFQWWFQYIHIMQTSFAVLYANILTLYPPIIPIEGIIVPFNVNVVKNLNQSK